MPVYRYNRRASMMQGADPGLTKMAAILGQSMSPRAQQSAYDQGQQAQSRMALALSQIGMHDAQAREHNAKANVLGNRGDVFNEMVANAAGTDVPTVFSYRNKLDGTPDMVEQGPPTEDGEMGTTPRQFDPALITKLGQAMRQFMPLITNAGDINPEQMAKASGEYRNQGLSDAIIAGQADRNTVGGAQAAVAGKDLFKTDSAGSVLDQYTGALNTANPLAQSTIAERGASAREKDAAAGRNQAQAQAALTNAQAHMITANRPHAGGKGIVRDTADGLMMIDPVTGEASPIKDENGQPMRGKTADKPMTEGQAKANLFGTRMQEANSILESASAAGVDMPSVTKQVAESVPLIGGALGAAANKFIASPEQQKVEQAQRDFVNAVLRRESGAAISQGEFDNAKKQYFPAIGDSPEVKAQKLRNRQTAIAGMLAEVPDQYRQQGGKPAAPPAAAPRGDGTVRIPAGPGSERARLLQGEYLAQTDPVNRAAVGRELQRLGIPIPQAPAAAPPQAAAPAAPGGWRIIGRE